jgi:hypothetical protein
MDYGFEADQLLASIGANRLAGMNLNLDQRLQLAQVYALRDIAGKLGNLGAKLGKLADYASDSFDILQEVTDTRAAEQEDPPVPDYDPGPEVDDEGGMSEHRYAVEPDEPSCFPPSVAF